MPTTIQSVEIEWGDTDEWREVDDNWPEFLYYGTKVIYNITELDASKNIIITLSDADASGATLTLDLDAWEKNSMSAPPPHPTNGRSSVAASVVLQKKITGIVDVSRVIIGLSQELLLDLAYDLDDIGDYRDVDVSASVTYTDASSNVYNIFSDFHHFTLERRAPKMSTIWNADSIIKVYKRTYYPSTQTWDASLNHLGDISFNTANEFSFNERDKLVLKLDHSGVMYTASLTSPLFDPTTNTFPQTTETEIFGLFEQRNVSLESENTRKNMTDQVGWADSSGNSLGWDGGGGTNALTYVFNNIANIGIFDREFFCVGLNKGWCVISNLHSASESPLYVDVNNIIRTDKKLYSFNGITFDPHESFVNSEGNTAWELEPKGYWVYCDETGWLEFTLD